MNIVVLEAQGGQDGKGKAGVRMQRDYIEVNSEVEKLYLNNHQLKSVSLSSLEIGF